MDLNPNWFFDISKTTTSFAHSGLPHFLMVRNSYDQGKQGSKFWREEKCQWTQDQWIADFLWREQQSPNNNHRTRKLAPSFLFRFINFFCKNLTNRPGKKSKILKDIRALALRPFCIRIALLNHQFFLLILTSFQNLGGQKLGSWSWREGHAYIFPHSSLSDEGKYRSFIIQNLMVNLGDFAWSNLFWPSDYL